MPRIRLRVHNLGFGLALLLIVLLGWQARRTQDALLVADAEVERSLEFVSVVQGMLSALQDVETGMRGFVITGEETFLEPYKSGQNHLVFERTRLRRLTAGRPDLAQWWQETDRAIDDRLDSARACVDVRREHGPEAAATLVATAGGKAAMDRVRALLGRLETEERWRLARQHEVVGKRVRQFQAWTTWGGLSALALLIAALVSVHRSMTHRRRATAVARAGEARQKAILQAIPDLLWHIGADGTLRLLSNADGATLPTPVEERLRRLCGQVNSGGVHLEEVTDGPRTYDLRMVAIDDGHLAIVRDVTSFVQQRRALQDQHGFLRTIVDTDDNLIFVREGSGRFTLCNLAFASLAGLRPSDVEGRLPGEIPGHRAMLPLLHGDESLMQSHGEWRADRIRIVDGRDTERWLQVLKRPLVQCGGERQVLTVAVDVSAQQRMERMKDEFISTISHELRTPLTSIRGALGLITSDTAGLPPAMRPLVDIAHKNTERLVRLINDILDIEKLQWGGLSLNLHRLPLRALVAQAVEQNATYAHELEVQLLFVPGDDGIAEVDVDRFAQVMANLLSNAIKHSRRDGRVEVGVAHRDDGLEVSVQDFGEGIPESFRPHVFERFAQADASDVRRRGGSGLGLAITRSLVEKMGGRIGFDSVVGAGTRFWVWLPEVARLHDPDPAPAPPVDAIGRPCIVLLQDDAALARELDAMLAESGFDTCVASDPAQVRSLLESRNARALAIDLASAGTAAHGLLRDVRSQPRFRFLPVLLLGVRPASGERDGLRGGVVGVIDWLGKPLDPQQVADAVRSCVREGQRERPDVLHVEDDGDVHAVLRNLLQDQPLNLHHAPTLAEARQQLARRRHDLVILDLMLPDGDGSELLPELSSARPPTPVIIFSARDNGVAESRAVLRRLVKSRSHAGELANLILETLRHWPASGGNEMEAG